MTTVRRRPFTMFFAFSALVAAACLVIVRSSLFARNPDILAWSVTLDLTLTIPLLYYLFVIRTGAARPITIAPAFAVCAALAAVAVPRGYQQTLHDLRFVFAPVEVITIILLVQRLRSMRRESHDGDVLERIELAALQIVGSRRAAAFLASEIGVVWYGITGWWRKADVPEGAHAFTVHKRSGWSALVAVFIFLIACESAAVHLLVQRWSVTAAWIITVLDIYGALWLLGDFNALRVRPSLVQNGVLRIRYGLRWSVTVRGDQIAAIREAGGESDWKRKDVLKVAMIDDPKLMIDLREPVVATGLIGLRKTINAIAISPDEDDALQSLSV